MNTEVAIEFLEIEIKCLEKEIEICNPNDDIDIQVIEANKNIIIKYNQVIILLQQGEKYKEKINILMSRENPYPEDIFTPIPKEDFAKINNLLKKELGYPIDRLSGHIGRELYKSFIETFKDK